MPLPDFLIIGAAKAGTSSLYHYLKQHPQVYMSPVKEPKFFALEGEALDFAGPRDQERMARGSITNFQDYCALFQDYSGEVAVGEASTLYLYSSTAAERIQHYIPHAKLIAILRNPVERAYSNYLHMIRNDTETLADFTQALKEEEIRIQNNWMPFWHYRQRGFYYAQLRRYYDLFDRDQIRIYLYEDLVADSPGLMRNIFQFISVDDSFCPDMSVKHNISGVPKNKVLHNLLIRSNPLKSAIKPLLPSRMSSRIAEKVRVRNLKKPSFDEEARLQLIETYRDDIVKLQELIDRDVSSWLK